MLKTKIHYYSYSVDTEQGRLAYESEIAKIERDGPRQWFHVLTDTKNDDYSQKTNRITDVELETDCLFNNQWNTSLTRVFDWYEGIYPNKHLKKGHWLEITPKMRAIRQTTLKCGYCGKHYPNGQPGFCTACLGSAYLKESELNLLRLLPVNFSFNATRPSLTPKEKSTLLPLYIDRQTKDASELARIKAIKERENIQHEYELKKQAVEDEYKGKIWLLDHDINLDNVIYYSHMGKFSFGWRTPLSPSVESHLLDILTEFPCDYELVTEKANV